MDQWTGLIQGVGVPAALLLVLVRGLWITGRWLGANVLQPVVARHIKFVDDVSGALVSMQENSRRVAESLTRFTEAQTALTERLGRQFDAKCQDAPTPLERNP